MLGAAREAFGPPTGAERSDPVTQGHTEVAVQGVGTFERGEHASIDDLQRGSGVEEPGNVFAGKGSMPKGTKASDELCA